MTFFSGLLARHFRQTLVLAFCWLVVVRASYVLQSGVVPDPLAMIAGDLAGAFVLAVLLCITRGISRVILVVVLGCATFVAGMHLTVHGTLFQLSLIGKGVDPTFVTGSLINIHALWLPVYLSLAWILHWQHRRIDTEALPAGRTGQVVVAVLVAAVYGVSFQSLTTPANNVVASFFAQIPGAIIGPLAPALSKEDEELNGSEKALKTLQTASFFRHQVAAPIVRDHPNVLLVMIEGMSGGYFPSLSRYHDLDPTVTLTSLEENLRRHGFRIYRNSLSMERQTDRGTFAILCGEYPDFRRQSRKMVDVAEGRVVVDCMPKHLKEHGYHTAYWQAAPLDYMQKGEFMPQAGFIDVTGATIFNGPEEEVEGWGPPDPIYFSNVAKRLRQLDEKPGPWMVTLLNVGTHHPFKIGKEPEQQPLDDELSTEDITPEPQEARKKAMRTMEDALNRFLDDLASDGILDDTLVIITSDESGGFIRKDHESVPLNSNVGVLAIRPPDSDSLEDYANRDQIVAQIDIPPTILDATGLGTEAGDMIGRSLMVKQPKQQRDLLLADTYTGLKYFLRESGQLLSCSELMTDCTTWRFNPERLFGTLEATNAEPFLTFDERTALFNRAALMKPAEDP